MGKKLYCGNPILGIRSPKPQQSAWGVGLVEPGCPNEAVAVIFGWLEEEVAS